MRLGVSLFPLAPSASGISIVTATRLEAGALSPGVVYVDASLREILESKLGMELSEVFEVAPGKVEIKDKHFERNGLVHEAIAIKRAIRPYQQVIGSLPYDEPLRVLKSSASMFMRGDGSSAGSSPSSSPGTEHTSIEEGVAAALSLSASSSCGRL